MKTSTFYPRNDLYCVESTLNSTLLYPTLMTEPTMHVASNVHCQPYKYQCVGTRGEGEWWGQNWRLSLDQHFMSDDATRYSTFPVTYISHHYSMPFSHADAVVVLLEKKLCV